MENIIPIDIGCLFAIVVKNGEKDRIVKALQIKSAEFFSWEIANQRKNETDKFDENGAFEMVIISDDIVGWNFIICNKIYDFKYSLNCCNLLKGEFEEIYSFAVDVHSGLYRFMKIHKGEMKRLFERDANHNTGEFGEELPEEKQMKVENDEHDYFHAVKLTQILLKEKEWIENKELFEKPVLVGKRYFKEIEKYPNLYIEPLKTKKLNLDDIDLPF
ncbi:MAG: hypothetical protein AB8B69_03215 [Chitinophagales bacterium]